ncbi:hypothetical protein [Sanguibacter massiliensis]|uniref:hypothetical protein n=1 Tax=Sanguibacter massiliensis TaxID=1973217 RepID=UPI001A92FB0A|nr:hypothetical protein [Sanguibacter massiliensis]
MEKFNNRLVAAQVATTMYIAGAFDRLKKDDRGQGSAEYMGIILVVVAIIGVVGMAQTEIGNAIKTQIVNAINSAKA